MKQKVNRFKYLTNGSIIENPILVIMIGLCPTLATSITAKDALGMGVAASFVLICSNIVVSAIRKFVPDSVRIPIFIIVISTFVTIVDYVMQAYVPALYRVLGVFVPLIVVNCIILGRAEAFAYVHGIFDSFLDGLGKALGFTLVLVVMGIFREYFSTGGIFGISIGPKFLISQPMLFMIFPPGGFLLIGIFKALINKFVIKPEQAD
jgi:electron transport complex protein RnfE